MTFELLPEHLKLLQELYWDANESCEAGSPGSDPKRPFGNSYVPGDVARILEWEVGEGLTREQVNRAWQIFNGLNDALKIILLTAKPTFGTYTKNTNHLWSPREK